MKRVSTKAVVGIWFSIVLIFVIFFARGLTELSRNDRTYIDIVWAKCAEKYGDDDVRVSACKDRMFLEEDERRSKTHNILSTVIVFVIPIGIAYRYIRQRRSKK